MSRIPFGSITLDPVSIGIQGNAILGIKESGKSYAATYLAEQLFAAGIPFVAFDPIGIWRYLRIFGKGKGIPVVVAGGQAPDLPLTPESAPVIVEAAMKQGVSLVIDLFDMHLFKGDWRKIVRDCTTLLVHKNKDYGLRHVFIEEAAEFVPQIVRDGDVYAAVEKLIRMGGNSRLGCTLINPRAQEVNKAVLELCENLFLFRQKGKNALDSLRKWLEVAGASGSEVMKDLPTLPQGECYAWLASSDMPIRIRVPEKNSFHPDRRVMLGTAEQQGAPVLGVKTDKFVEAMLDSLPRIAEEKKANDPKVMRGEIARLTRELAAAGKAKGTPAPAPAPIVANAVEIEAARQAGIAEGIQRARAALDNLGDKLPPVRRAIPTKIVASDPAPPVVPAEGVTGPQQRILNALAWWKAFGIEQPTNEQVAFIAGYSPTSTGYTNPRGALSALGLLSYPSRGLVQLTEAGEGKAEAPGQVPTTEVMHQRIMDKLSGPQQRVFKPILQAHPKAISNDDVAAQAGYSPTSTGYTNPRGSLSALNLIEYPQRGFCRAADWLFP